MNNNEALRQMDGEDQDLLRLFLCRYGWEQVTRAVLAIADEASRRTAQSAGKVIPFRGR